MSAVMISCKVPVGELKTVKDYRNLLEESMFFHALNQRFFKISRKKDPPFFSCLAAADVLVRAVKAYIMTSSCKEKGTVEALESMLTEAWDILGCGIHGRTRTAISLYHRMEEEGVSCFMRMVRHYGLRPGIEHYGCMIDLLGRAGLLEDAHKLKKTLRY